MNENIKSETQNNTSNETDAYFNSLFENQKEEAARGVRNMRYFKLFSLVFLILIICVSLYFAVSFYMRSTGSDLNVSTSGLRENSNSGAYFSPDYYLKTERKLAGEISINSNFGNDSEREFELLDDNGKNIAYIYSRKNDLSLSVGLEVEIEGRLVKTTSSGIEIIEVSSIRLK